MHNFYLQILVEFGLIGLIVWIGILCRIFYLIVKVKDHFLKKIFIISLSIILFGWCFTNLSNIINYLSILFASGLSYLMIKERNTNKIDNNYV